MSTVKKGILTVSLEWAKHLRRYGKKAFWKGERNAEKQLIKNHIKNQDHER